MPISAQQWRLAVGRANASRNLRPHVTGQPKMKLTSFNVILFTLTALLGAILLCVDRERGTGERKCVSRRSGGGGTVGELAPSLLTAPWRKELLMLAGDVETNPGPYTDYVGELRLSDLELVMEELRGVEEKWRVIGRELTYVRVNDIMYPDPTDCLREVVRRRLQSIYTTTWGQIIIALRKANELQLADNLKAKYIPDLLEESDLDLLTQELRPVQHKWESIGRELDLYDWVSADNTHYQYQGDDGDRLRAMLKRQLQYTPTWRNIVHALRSPDVGESQLADELEAKYCPTAQKILEKALEKGYVDCHIWKVLVTGAAGSGKSTLKHRLFGKEVPSVRCSTALAEAAIRAISREIVGTDQTGWFQVTHKELMELLGGAVKAGVPMEELAAIQKKRGILSRLFFWKDKQSKGAVKQSKRAHHSAAVSSSRPSAQISEASSHTPTTSASAPVSYSKQELVQVVEKSQGSKRFLELQWIHFIDSGGQPQFHEVLPAFITNTTSTIFVMKLSERLDEHPMIEYYDRNGELLCKPYPHALSNDQILQCCIQTIHSRPATREGKHSKTLVVGTHRDLEYSCSESRVEKNRKLMDILTPSLQCQLVHYSLGSEVIFPINAKEPDCQDQEVCAMIRKHIEDKKCAPPPYKIPIGWFLLEQDITKASQGGVNSKKECLSIAAVLNINAEALQAALEYFDELNIFLYYPSVLPDVVFSNPQVLLDKVTELVHFNYSLHSDNSPVALESKWLQFRDKGIVTVDMFQDERFSTHYIPDLFTSADLIKLLEHLLIIAPLSSTEYFMPSLLQMASSEKILQKLTPSSLAAPLLVHFPAGCARNGIFCALVVYLLSKCHWEFAKGTLECVSRSCVCFKIPDTPVSIALADSFSFFKVSVEAPHPMYSKVCPKIREVIFSGVEAAARALKYNNSKPKPAFLCSKCSSESPPHAATPTVDNCYLVCTKSESFEPVTEQHTAWFNVKQPATKSPKPTQKQLLQQLYNTVPDKWHPIGIYLEIPEGQLNAIDAKHRGDPQKCLMAMLTESWLPRVPPPTWAELAEAVEFVGYPDVAQKLREKFCSQKPNPHTHT